MSLDTEHSRILTVVRRNEDQVHPAS